MNFIVDAQLPKLDLPLRNHTSDNDILDLAEKEKRIVVTKDDDFVQSYLVTGRPPKLLFVATGNISNNELEKLIQTNLKKIEVAFEEHHFVEIGRKVIAIHE